jgi:hypothetical protein
LKLGVDVNDYNGPEGVRIMKAVWA